jgi:hypothetical protein
LRADGAVTHGAHSPARIAPARERHLERLREQFPQGDVTIIGLQATRLAMLDLVADWLGNRGPIRNRRTGTTWPCVDLWAKTASAFERTHERLEHQQRESGGGTANALGAIEAELASEGRPDVEV